MIFPISEITPSVLWDYLLVFSFRLWHFLLIGSRMTAPPYWLLAIEISQFFQSLLWHNFSLLYHYLSVLLGVREEQPWLFSVAPLRLILNAYVYIYFHP